VKVKVKKRWSKNSMKRRVSKLKHYQLYYLVVQVILQLGNEILRNLGVEEPIDDVAVFFR
jgi:hypothetical protein